MQLIGASFERSYAGTLQEVAEAGRLLGLTCGLAAGSHLMRYRIHWLLCLVAWS